jgi:hypothetical protein
VRVVGHQLVRAAQQIQRLGIIVFAHQVETESVPDIGIVGLDRHRLLQEFRPLFVHATRPIEIREVDEGGDEIGSRRKAVRYSFSASGS